MDRYCEYPIRCFTCGASIDGYAQDYEELVLKGMSRDQVLSELGFPKTEDCCRNSFFSPTTVFFNMQNDDVVSGITRVGKKKKKSIEKSPASETKEESLFDEPDEFVSLEEFETSKLPTIPGVPVINESPTPNRVIQVGIKRKTLELTGRTYKAE